VNPDVWRSIKTLLADHGIVEIAFERALIYADRARQHLSSAFPPSTERDALLALTDYVLSRDR
jgi:geranylgeranyl pyrophosphate synthase